MTGSQWWGEEGSDVTALECQTQEFRFDPKGNRKPFSYWSVSRGWSYQPCSRGTILAAVWRTEVDGGQRNKMKTERPTRINPGERWEGCAWHELLWEAKKGSTDWYWCYNDTEDVLSQPFCMSAGPQAGLKKKKGATFNSETTSQSGWGSLGPRVYEGLARAWASLLAHLPLWYFPATAWLLEVPVKVAQSCPTLCNPMDCNSLGQNTGVGSLSLLQGIFPIQASNPGLPHCRQILYQLSYRGSKGGTSSWDKGGNTAAAICTPFDGPR